jgi:hypothetical protein
MRNFCHLRCLSCDKIRHLSFVLLYKQSVARSNRVPTSITTLSCSFFILVMEHYCGHAKKDLVLMLTSYRKTLKAVGNVGEKA